MRDWNPIAACTYIITWLGLAAWCVMLYESVVLDIMWISLNSGRPGYALLKAVNVPLLLFPMISILLNAGRNLQSLGGTMVKFPQGTIPKTVIMILLLLVPLLFLAFSNKNQKRLNQMKEDFRLIINLLRKSMIRVSPNGISNSTSPFQKTTRSER